MRVQVLLASPLALALLVHGCVSSSSEDPKRDGAAPAEAGTADGGPSTGDADGADGSGEAGAQPIVLFDGVLGPDWKMTTIKNQPGRDDPGRFDLVSGTLVSRPGTDLGMLWNTRPTPVDFVLELEWKLSAQDDNSGVFVRFPSPDSKGYDNTSFVAVDFGFEIQINEPGVPDGAPMHTTGAVYGQADQTFTRVVANPPGTWNAFEIRVEKQVYVVRLNGLEVTRFVNATAGRGLPSTAAAPSYVGLQTHSGNVAFRKITLRAL